VKFPIEASAKGK